MIVRQWWAAALLVCAGVGLLSVALGPDNYWDLRYYHLYAPWAYLHDRYLYDLGPAQEQGFLNPVADLLLYGLISSPLNETPRVISFIMGAVHGINAALLLAIVVHVIRPPDKAERLTLRAVAWLMGVTGGGFVPLIGTSSNDLTTSLFVLGALLGVIEAVEPSRGKATARAAIIAFAAAGLSAGLAIGLKNTSAVYAPGLGVVVILAALQRRSFGGLVLFGVAAGVGFIAVTAHHMLTLWRDFGNPVFPYMNQIFHSPYFEPTAIRDDRFIPHGLWGLLTFPFSWTVTDTYIVVEHPFRDWRAAIAYVAMVAGVVGFATHRLRRDDRWRVTEGQTRGLALVYVFVAVSYVAWALGFGYYRYVVPLEMLTGVVTVGALIWLLKDRRLCIGAAIVVLAVAAVTTVYPNWGRRPYDGGYVDVHVPPLPANAVVLIATWDPAAFFIPYAESRAQYVGIENNYLELSQHNKLANAVKQAMREPGRPKFVVNVDALDREKMDGLLGHFGLQLGPSPCLPIETT
jgi:hypothetical protein